MQKDFDKWNEIKKKTENKGRPSIKLGSIYWCRFGVNVGVEEDGKNDNFRRPCLVIKKFSNEIVLVVPLTTKIKTGDWYFNFKFNDIDQSAILNQIKVVDTKRLDQYIGLLDTKRLKEIVESVINLIRM